MSIARLVPVLLSATLLLSFSVPTRVSAQPQGVGLFSSVSGGQGYRFPENALPGKSRVVRVKPKMLRNGRLLMNLGIGPELDLERTRLAVHKGGGNAWIGRVKGDPHSEIILASKGSSG